MRLRPSRRRTVPSPEPGRAAPPSAAAPAGSSLEVPEASAFSFPLAGFAPSGGAFERIWRHPGCRKWPIVHPGVDFHGTSIGGTTVAAITDGLVVYVAPDQNGDGHPDSWGGVVLEHLQAEETFFSQYGHVDSIRVAAGDIVRAGEPIASVGSVGRPAHGPHLHLEIRTAAHPDPRNGGFWSCRGFARKRTVRSWYRDPAAFLLERGAERPASDG